MRFSLLVLVMVFVGFGDLVCTDAAVPLSSSTRPFIAKHRAQYPAACSVQFVGLEWLRHDALSSRYSDSLRVQPSGREKLIARVQSNLAAYEADRDSYLLNFRSTGRFLRRAFTRTRIS